MTNYVTFKVGDCGLIGDHAVLPVGLQQELDLEFVMELVDVVLGTTLKLKIARISHVPVCHPFIKSFDLYVFGSCLSLKKTSNTKLYWYLKAGLCGHPGVVA